MKNYISKPLILSWLVDGENIMLYLAMSKKVVSAILVRGEGSYHLPVYYMSKVMLRPETRYSSIEKLPLALTVVV